MVCRQLALGEMIFDFMLTSKTTGNALPVVFDSDEAKKALAPSRQRLPPQLRLIWLDLFGIPRFCSSSFHVQERFANP